jgi:Flp pilus assembly protein TadB
MKLLDAIIFSVALALIVVGIHQTMVLGIGFSYSLFMFAVGLLFWFQLRRNKARESNESQQKKSMKSDKHLKKRNHG